MMIMTIWWSKATRLLEFSRSFLRSRALLLAAPDRRPSQTCGPGFFVTDEDEELGILVYSKWMGEVSFGSL